MLLTKPLYLSSELHERCEVRQLTCFTGTKVQILTPEELSAAFLRRLYQFTCFTGAKVQILTPEELSAALLRRLYFSLLALLAQKYKY
jgi:hypothetical protein